MLDIPEQFAVRLQRATPYELVFSSQGPLMVKVLAWLLVTWAALAAAVNILVPPVLAWSVVGVLGLAVWIGASHELTAVFDIRAQSVELRLRWLHGVRQRIIVPFSHVSLAVYEGGVEKSFEGGRKELLDVRVLAAYAGDNDVILATGDDVDRVAAELTRIAGLECTESPNWYRIVRQWDFRTTDSEERQELTKGLILFCMIVVLAQIVMIAQWLGRSL